MRIDAISSTHSGILQLSICTFTFSIATNAVSIPFVGNRPNRLVDFIFISPGDAPGFDEDGRWPTKPTAKAQFQN
ncbi:hypothetical protein [Rhodopirellula islandica]|uniref:hypothetical protein n=1 Tax=Rhodopirellula islandica TaxID=595434 RepID=UPI0009F8931F|nr:hypothetical protein [Rhodopirellula islandica]